MKSFQAILLAVVLACATAFAPVAQTSAAVKPLQMSKVPEPAKVNSFNKEKAAIAAFATAIAPLAAHADDLESQAIGLGIGLVACVVSLAVGFAIGYGTLVKL